MEDKYNQHTVKEIIAIGKRDCGGFAAICNYYLFNDYERFKFTFNPIFEKMILDYKL